MRDWEDIKEDILSRVDFRQVAEWDGLAMKKGGAGLWVACCPFHTEKSGSFNIGGKKGFEHRGHCFGCGWDGDVFAFWMERRGCDFKTAVMDLASLAHVPVGDGVEWTRPEVKRVRQPERRPDVEVVRPNLPPLRHLRREECAVLGKARGIDPEAIWVAARTFKMAAFSSWPMYEGHDGVWRDRTAGAWPSWCAIDETRFTAEFRRLDNGMYPKQDGGEIKAWGCAGKNWPLGAASLNGRKCVLLVEGGPDMLAAYDLLMRWRMIDKVAVVCMLGAGNRMREEAMAHFEGCRVRIMVDADALKDANEPDSNGRLVKRKVPGMEAALRWEEQLTGAGAAVESFFVGPVYEPASLARWYAREIDAAAVAVVCAGLTDVEGKPVKDVNDLIRAGPEVMGREEVRAAARAWDF